MTDPELAKALAQNLLQVMAPYEEELMALEISSPAVGHLRRAVSMVVAEACYCIAESSAAPAGWSAVSDNPAGPNR